jgi:hypothetical protein
MTGECAVTISRHELPEVYFDFPASNYESAGKIDISAFHKLLP